MFHYSKLNMKPPAIGSVVEWHQDLSFYPLTNSSSLAVLIYLDDADVANGCLQVIPGCQTGRLLDHTRDGYFVGKIAEAIDETQAVPLEGKAGTAIFMDCMTPHASVTNTSDRPRRTLILSYRAGDSFPIYAGDFTMEQESYSRLVRGNIPHSARFSFEQFPIPRHKQRSASLYQLRSFRESRLLNAEQYIAQTRPAYSPPEFNAVGKTESSSPGSRVSEVVQLVMADSVLDADEAGFFVILCELGVGGWC